MVLLKAADVPVVTAVLAIGGLHLIVDGFNELSLNEKERVSGWLLEMHRAYPRVPVVALSSLLRL